MNQSLHATCKSQLRLPAPQAFAGEMQSHERRRTRRVYGETGPFQIKGVRNPIGSNATGVSSEDERFVVRREVLVFGSPKQSAVIRAGNAHENANRAAT